MVVGFLLERSSIGDSLEFVYNQKDYNVVAVDKHAYETCKEPEGAFEYNSGDDTASLKKGENYFIALNMDAVRTT